MKAYVLMDLQEDEPLGVTATNDLRAAVVAYLKQEGRWEDREFWSNGHDRYSAKEFVDSPELEGEFKLFKVPDLDRDHITEGEIATGTQ